MAWRRATSASTSLSQNSREPEGPKNLKITLRADRDIRIKRSFDAPRELVWDARTYPALERR